jgi:hypothetical protein
MSYSSSAEVFSDRVRWASALLAELLFEARTNGWIEGAPASPTATSSAARALIRERLAPTSIDVTVLPIEWLRIRLQLDESQCDALWLLICVELDLSLARLAQVFGSPDCPDLSAQVWQRLVPLSESAIERLGQLGLIETTADERLPRHRRRVRAADRVLELVRGELRLDPAVGRFAELVPPAKQESEIPLPDPSSLFVAVGVEGAGRATVLRRAVNASGSGTLEIRVPELSRDRERCRAELRAAVREARLFGVVPLLRELTPQLDEISGVIEREVLHATEATYSLRRPPSRRG